MIDLNKENIIKNSSITDSLNYAMVIYGSSKVTLQNNIFYNAQKYGLYLNGPQDVIFENNNIMKVRNRPWYNNLSDLDIIIGFYIDKGDIDLVEKNIKI